MDWSTTIRSTPSASSSAAKVVRCRTERASRSSFTHATASRRRRVGRPPRGGRGRDDSGLSEAHANWAWGRDHLLSPTSTEGLQSWAGVPQRSRAARPREEVLLALDRPPPDPEGGGDLPDRPTRLAEAKHTGPGPGVDPPGASQLPPPPARGSKPCHGPLPDQVPLKLPDRGEPLRRGDQPDEAERDVELAREEGNGGSEHPVADGVQQAGCVDAADQAAGAEAFAAVHRSRGGGSRRP